MSMITKRRFLKFKMDEDKNVTYCNTSNKYLLTDDITVDELRIYLKLRFASLKEAGYAAGISEGRVRQILICYDLPKSSKLIGQIAKGWSVDAIKLARLFERERSSIKEKLPDFITADKYTNVTGEQPQGNDPGEASNNPGGQSGEEKER